MWLLLFLSVSAFASLTRFSFFTLSVPHMWLINYGSLLFTSQIPNYGLALAVAQEWASPKDKIVPSLMHLVSLGVNGEVIY